MTVRVKICGVTHANDAIASIEAGADLIGLNFFAPSPRYVSIERARLVRDAIGMRVKVVGVFVNATRDYVDERMRALSLDLLQFSGDEKDEMLTGWPVPVIAAYKVKVGETGRVARRAADFILVDAFDSKLYGGTGSRISLEQLRSLDTSRAFIAGGLTPENVADVASLLPYGVDCASGVESSPGVKDHTKLRSFVANAKRAR
ncbi:MAG TPA: phosphoribosylanthranilate isomerase, partial [Candidatus Dormibacteraeota bacterium]|nr:phosphoribosylanthranilate isomerase [Candidatus Dormibacteraeota bacterium]